MKGKVAVVTGSGRGIGRATAIALAKEGAKIVITARNTKEMEETLREVSKFSEGITIRCDVSKERDVENLFSQAMKKFGKIDMLVNNAGVAYYEPFSKMDAVKVREMIDTNLHGIFNTTREALKHMKSGVVVNVSSGAGKNGIGGLAVYCASKFGVLGFTESMAQETKSVKFYSVCPGGVDTNMYFSMFRRHPALKAEDVAEKIKEVCEGKLPSGTSVDVRK